MNWLSNALNPDQSQAGAAAGEADALAGKPKSGVGALNLKTMVYGYDNSASSYVQSYNLAYDATLATRAGAATLGLGTSIAAGTDGRATAEELETFAAMLARAAQIISAETEQWIGSIRAQQAAGEWDDDNFAAFLSSVQCVQAGAMDIADTHLTRMVQQLRNQAEALRRIAV